MYKGIEGYQVTDQEQGTRNGEVYKNARREQNQTTRGGYPGRYEWQESTQKGS